MSRLISGSTAIGLYKWINNDPVLDRRRNLWDWANAIRPDFTIWVGPMMWPQSRMGVVTEELPFPDPAVWWEVPVKMLVSGMSGGYHICGTVRYNGAPAGAVTLQVFRASDEVFVGQAISGPEGEYVVTVPTNVAHYIVGYVTGAPDKTGATVNTLIPTEARVI